LTPNFTNVAIYEQTYVPSLIKGREANAYIKPLINPN